MAILVKGLIVYNGILMLNTVVSMFSLFVAGLVRDPGLNAWLSGALMSAFGCFLYAKVVIPQVMTLWRSKDHRNNYDKILVSLSFLFVIVGLGCMFTLGYLDLLYSEDQLVCYIVYGATAFWLMGILIPTCRHPSYNPSEDQN